MMIFGPFFTPDVTIFQSKILATPISHGKNFRGVFFDAFHKSEPESEKNSALGALFAEIYIEWCKDFSLLTAEKS